MGALEHRLGVLEDVHAIRRLQHAYGYYLDKCLYDEVVDLFSDAGEVAFMGGLFRGKAGLCRLYCDRFRRNFTGILVRLYSLLDHPQLRTSSTSLLTTDSHGRPAIMQAGSRTDQGTGMLPQQCGKADCTRTNT
jgi:hypothetical protein